MEILGIGIHANEFNTTHFGLDHVVQSVFTGSADTDYFDMCNGFNFRIDFRHRNNKARRALAALMIIPLSVAKFSQMTTGESTFYDWETCFGLWQIDELTLYNNVIYLY